MFQPKNSYIISAVIDDTNTGLRVWPVVIEYDGVEHTTGLSIVKIGRAYSIRLIEKQSNKTMTHYIPADTLGSAMATVRSMMKRSIYRSDEKIVTMIDGYWRTLLELKLL